MALNNGHGVKVRSDALLAYFRGAVETAPSGVKDVVNSDTNEVTGYKVWFTGTGYLYVGSSALNRFTGNAEEPVPEPDEDPCPVGLVMGVDAVRVLKMGMSYRVTHPDPIMRALADLNSGDTFDAILSIPWSTAGRFPGFANVTVQRFKLLQAASVLPATAYDSRVGTRSGSPRPDAARAGASGAAPSPETDMNIQI